MCALSSRATTFSSGVFKLYCGISMGMPLPSEILSGQCLFESRVEEGQGRAGKRLGHYLPSGP